MKDCPDLHPSVVDSLAQGLEIVCVAKVGIEFLYIGDPEPDVENTISIGDLAAEKTTERWVPVIRFSIRSRAFKVL